MITKSVCVKLNVKLNESREKMTMQKNSTKARTLASPPRKRRKENERKLPP